MMDMSSGGDGVYLCINSCDSPPYIASISRLEVGLLDIRRRCTTKPNPANVLSTVRCMRAAECHANKEPRLLKSSTSIKRDPRRAGVDQDGGHFTPKQTRIAV